MPAIAGAAPVNATDDWPFLYLRTPFVAPCYLFALGLVLLFALAALALGARVSGTSVRKFSLHFFVLRSPRHWSP